ncbi:MAG: hypothetical protein M3Q31_18415 [Actinomycetota bacterium]|nr:hypothetical protein [Actinomycetota bacterium]
MVVPNGSASAWQLTLLLAGLVVASLAQTSVAAARTEASKAGVTNVIVTLGKTSEYAITLSTNRVAVGTVAFKVTNRGTLPHDFKVCAHATGSTTPNDCVGRTSSTLRPGASAVLEVVFKQEGSFEYLSTVPGHAKAGTGLLDVGQNAYGGEKLALAQKAAECMHSHGFPSYPGNGNLSGTGSKPSAQQANAAEKSCEKQARKALGLP